MQCHPKTYFLRFMGKKVDFSPMLCNKASFYTRNGHFQSPFLNIEITISYEVPWLQFYDCDFLILLLFFSMLKPYLSNFSI